MDRGSETIARLVAKLDDYTGPNQAVAERLEGMILFWVPTLARERSLRAALATHRCPVPIATTAAEIVDAAGPAGPMWAPMTRIAAPATRIVLGELADAIGGTDPDGTPPDGREVMASENNSYRATCD